MPSRFHDTAKILLAASPAWAMMAAAVDRAGNRFHSFRKAGLARLEKEFGKTLMPSFGATLSAGELDDLVAYLAGLRGGT